MYFGKGPINGVIHAFGDDASRNIAKGVATNSTNMINKEAAIGVNNYISNTTVKNSMKGAFNDFGPTSKSETAKGLMDTVVGYAEKNPRTGMAVAAGAGVVGLLAAGKILD